MAEREERGERLRQCKHRDKDMVTSPPITYTRCQWPDGHIPLWQQRQCYLAESPVLISIWGWDYQFSSPLWFQVPNAAQSPTKTLISSNCTESCMLRSNATKITLGREKKHGGGKKKPIKQKINRQTAIKVWMRESRRRWLQLDGSSVLVREGKIKRTGGVLFSQRSLAAGSALLRARCLRMHVCVSLSVWYTCLSDICLCIHVCL